MAEPKRGKHSMKFSALYFRLKLLRNNLGGRLLLYTLATSMVIFAMISLVLFSIQQRSISSNLYAERSSLCADANSIAESACAYLRGVADSLCNDLDMATIILNAESKAAKMASEMFSQYAFRGYALNIILYDVNGMPIEYMTIDNSAEPVQQDANPIFQSLINGSAYSGWMFSDERSQVLFKRDHSPKITFFRVIRRNYNSNVLGAIAVSMDSRRLLGYEVSYNSSYRKNFIVYDVDSGMTLSNYTHLELDKEICDNISASIDDRKDGKVSMLIGDEESSVYFQRVSGTPFVTLYITNNTVMDSLESFMSAIFIVFICFIFAIIPLMHFINKYLTRPLERLTHEMNVFSHGDYNASFPTATGDTIGNLGNAFNHMVQENKKLVEEKYIAQLQAKEAELSLLQSQINPHFIYNLINSLQWTAINHGEEEIANIAHSLGQVLRISLNRGDPMIPISRECDLARYYLTLQKSRYGERLNYELELQPEAADICIPKLILQPLIENCVVHGTENSLEAINIYVNVSIEDGRLLLEVEDDGTGIPPETLRMLPDKYASESSAGNGFAIKNIYERLQLIYGADFELNIHSELDFGTFVSISLPIEKPSGKDEEECLQS